MPTYQATDPSTGRTVEMTGAAPPTEQDIIAAFAALPDPARRQPEQIDRAAFQEPTIGEGLLQAASSVVEPAAQFIQGAALAIPAGLSGAAALVGGAGIDEAAEQVSRVQNLGVQPQTEAGINSLQSLGASAPVQAIEKGTRFLGDELESGGLFPPGVGGAIGSSLPTAAGLALGVRGQLGKAPNRTPTIADLGTKAPKVIPKPVQKAIPTLDDAGNTIGVKLPPVPKVPSKAVALTNQLKAGSIEAPTAGFKLNGTGTGVVADKIERAALKQGFKPGAIAALRRANTSTKAALNKMLDTVENVKNNAVKAISERPSDILGESLGKRVEIIRKANRSAGQSLDEVAQGLKGQQVDVTQPVNNFMTALEKAGIRVGRDLKPKFKGSSIQGIKGPQKAIKEVIERMKDIDKPDAFALHEFKRFLDERLDFGKSPKGGLTARTTSILKKLRRDVDQALDAKFPEYDRVNTVFSETRKVLDDVQDAAGKKIDLTADGADSALGTLARRITSKAQSRVQIRNMATAIDKLAKKHGKGVDLTDDLDQLLVFVDEVETVFKSSVPQNSFGGQLLKSVPQVAAQSKAQTILDIGRGAAKKVPGIKNAFASEESALKAIRAVINQ